jgi:hypothetical protein
MKTECTLSIHKAHEAVNGGKPYLMPQEHPIPRGALLSSLTFGHVQNALRRRMQ